MAEDLDLSVILLDGGGPGHQPALRCLGDALREAGLGHEVVCVAPDVFPDGLMPFQGRHVASLDIAAAQTPGLLLGLWRERGTAEVLVGAPPPAAQRRASRELLDRLLARWLGLPLRHASSPVRLYDGAVLSQFVPAHRGAAAHSELLVRIYAEGWRVREIPLPAGSPARSATHLGEALAHLRSFPSLWRLRNSIASADYDDRAYDSAIRLQRYWQRRRVGHVLDLVGGRGPVLDVGCGSSRILAGLPHGSVGVDILLRKLRYARAFGRPLVQASGLRLPFGDEVFPVVVCSQVIEHVLDGGLLLDELKRVLAPGGRLVLGSPDYGGWQWPVLEAVYRRVAPGAYADEHVNCYTWRELVQSVESRGLRLEEGRTILRAEMILAFGKPADPP